MPRMTLAARPPSRYNGCTSASSRSGRGIWKPVRFLHLVLLLTYLVTHITLMPSTTTQLMPTEQHGLSATAEYAQRVLAKEVPWVPLPQVVEKELDTHFSLPAARFDQYKWDVRFQIMHAFLEHGHIGRRSELDIGLIRRIADEGSAASHSADSIQQYAFHSSYDKGKWNGPEAVARLKKIEAEDYEATASPWPVSLPRDIPTSGRNKRQWLVGKHLYSPNAKDRKLYRPLLRWLASVPYAAEHVDEAGFDCQWEAGLDLILDQLYHLKQSALAESEALTPMDALQVAIAFLPAINDDNRLYEGAMVLTMYVGPGRLRTGGSLAGGHDTTHMGGGLQAYDEGRVLDSDFDVGLDEQALTALLTQCRLLREESICMSALISAIMFPFDVAALAYACKNYRRSMFELILYTALKSVLRDDAPKLVLAEALLCRAKEGNDTPRYNVDRKGAQQVELHKKTLNFDGVIKDAHGYPIPEVHKSFDKLLRPFMLSELLVRHNHKLRIAAMEDLDALNTADPRLPSGLLRSIAEYNEQNPSLDELRAHKLLMPKTEKAGAGNEKAVEKNRGVIPAQQTHRKRKRDCMSERREALRAAAATPEVV